MMKVGLAFHSNNLKRKTKVTQSSGWFLIFGSLSSRCQACLPCFWCLQQHRTHHRSVHQKLPQSGTTAENKTRKNNQGCRLLKSRQLTPNNSSKYGWDVTWPISIRRSVYELYPLYSENVSMVLSWEQHRCFLSNYFHFFAY